MTTEKKKDLLPVITTLGCLGVATTTSVIGGTYFAGLAGKVILDLFGNLSSNIASDQLLKINPVKLRSWWDNSSQDISNHDLFKALKQSLIMALKATEEDYHQRFSGKVNKYHFKAIREKIQLLCEYIEAHFENEFAGTVDDQMIKAFEEGYDESLFEVFNDFLKLEDLKGHGNDFLPFVKEQLPLNITRAFTELLKVNQRVWVAYQRLLLTDIQDSNHQLGTELGSLSNKIDELHKQIQTLDNCLNGGQADLAEFLWEQFQSAKAYWSFSQEQLSKYQEDLSFVLKQLQMDLVNEIKEQEQYRRESRESLKEILQRLENGDGYDEKEMENKVLPKYLQWVIQEYSSISLPAIQEKKSRQSIPLERVYVALELTDEATRKDFQYGSQLIKQRIREEEAACGRRLDEEERSEIRSKVLQKNRTLSSYQMKKMDKADLNNNEYSGFVSLAQVFQNERHLLILGDPGSGKSTIAKWLTLQSAKAMLNGEDRVMVNAEQVLGKREDDDTSTDTIDLGPVRLPVLIKIPEFTKYYEEFQFNQSQIDRGRGIIDFCGFHLPTIPGLEASKVQQLIKHFLIKNQAVIFLDGMDEVVKNRDKIIDEIEKFIQYWVNLGEKNKWAGRPKDRGGNQVVVTSRVVGYHAAPLRSEITHVYVREMDDNAILSFCELWTQQIMKDELRGLDPEDMQKIIDVEADGLKQAIFDKSKPRIKELATNPLLVTILALLYRFQNKQLPKSRVELYEQSINILVGKWKSIHKEKQSITKVELNKLLEALAEHIHSSPSEDITEYEMTDLLEQELKAIRGFDPDSPENTNISGQIEGFIKIIKEDVGLLSERGEKLYHFLHRTFQEYLASRRLVSNPQTAITNIIDRLSDPVWREPVLLSVAYANSYWSTERFNKLVDSLLSAEDTLKDLVPRGILLIATALPDLEKLSLELFKKLVREFLEAFGNRQGIGRFQPIRDAIKTIIDNLRSSDRKQAFLEVCHQLIEEPEVYGPAQWALLSLAAKDSWIQIEWIDHLLDHLQEDAADWDWPIDQVLLLTYARRANQLQNPLLTFRQKLIDDPSFSEFIQKNPAWLRLVMVLYGGIEYDPRVEKYKELEQLFVRFATKQIDMKEEGQQAAIRLDTELGMVNHFRRNTFSFSPNLIHRETPFTRLLLRNIQAQQPAEELVSLFYDVWQNGEEEEDTRAQALLALAALGENVARIIYLIDDDSEETEAALRFLKHLNRLERNLSAPFLSMAVTAKKYNKLQEWGWHQIPLKESSYVWSTLCKAISRAGLVPLNFFPSDPAQNMYSGEKRLISSYWPSFILREAESYASLVGMSMEDPVYSTAVVLDNIGKALQGPNNQYILDAICEIPYTANIKNPYAFEWKMPEFWFPPESEKEQLTLALQLAYGLPDDYFFLREFITRSLWNRMAEYPFLQYLAIALFVNRKHGTITDYLKTELFGEGPLLNRIIQALDEIEDPYFKFLTAFYLNKQVIIPNLLDDILFASLEAMDNPREWFAAYMLLHSRDVQIHVLIGDLWGLYTSRSSKTLSILNDPNPEQLILSKLEKIPAEEAKIRGLVFGAAMIVDQQKPEFIFKAMEMIPKIKEDKERARSLLLILDHYQSIATKYPNWDQINASFKDPYWLNRALSKEYMNLFELEVFMDREGEDWKVRSFMWNTFGLVRMSQELDERFEDRDIDGALINRILNSRKEKEALAAFLERNKDGFPISNRNVRFLDELLAGGRKEKAKVLLPLMESRGMGDLRWLKHWAQHEIKEFKLFYDLIQAESGFLNEQILDSLIEILKHSPDRLKFRAAIAIHSTYVSCDNNDRTYSINNLGFDFLCYLYKQVLRMYISHPDIGNVLSWFASNVVHDDPSVIEKAILLQENGNLTDMRIAKRIFYSIERASDEVILELCAKLRELPVVSGWIIWGAIARLLYNEPYLTISNRKLLNDFVGEIKRTPHLIDSLMEFGKNKSIASIEIIGEALLSVKDSEGIDWNTQFKQVLAFAKKSCYVDVASSVDDEQAIKKALITLGGDYYNEATVQFNCERYARRIESNIDLIKILIKWTFDQLEEDLISSETSALGGELAMLLSEVAGMHPEIFQSLVNQKIALKILPEVIKYHRGYTARRGAIGLLAHLKALNTTILDAIVLALTDVDIVSKKAVRSLGAYSEIVDEKTLNKLEAHLNGPSAQVGCEMTRLLANISAQSALDTSLRKKTISILAKALREQITEPAKRRSLYHFTTSRNSLFNLDGNIEYAGEFENVLYEELVKLAGL